MGTVELGWVAAIVARTCVVREVYREAFRRQRLKARSGGEFTHRGPISSHIDTRIQLHVSQRGGPTHLSWTLAKCTGDRDPFGLNRSRRRMKLIY